RSYSCKYRRPPGYPPNTTKLRRAVGVSSRSTTRHHDLTVSTKSRRHAKMDRQALHRFVHEDAALRRRQVLQPVGGQGDKIFPTTYPPERQGSPPRHVYERRLIAGEQKWCVLVDSVQAQSNRLEEALLNAAADGLSIPHLVVDFAGSGI